MKIKNVEIKNKLVLAPMAGVSDISFRKLCSFYGAGLTETEMVSVKGLYYKSKKTLELLRTFENEHPVAVQLFGHEKEIFEKVLKSNILDNFDIIDINMGCPAPKIVKNGDGSALLKNLEKAKEIIETCVKSTDKPIMVKFRKGFYEESDILIPFAKMCEEAGASIITVHPRTREQGYSGKIDFDDIKKVKESVNIVVVGNGDVVDLESYKKMENTGCDLIMIGRGAVGNADIFSVLQGGKREDRKKLARLHLKYLKEYFDEKYIVNTFKRHAFHYVEKKEDKVRIATAKTTEEIEDIIFNN